ncbi:MAG: hypothetical protein M3406_18340 [Chloroflexota bacterium]|nr:hypothetical protein [Chloroflexota bacterium]
MNGDRETRDLEDRLSRTLHQLAPRPDPHMAERLLSRTAATPQRRGWSFFATGFGGVAVVVLAIFAGLALGQLPRNVGNIPHATESPARVSSEPSPIISPIPDEPTPSASPSAGELGDGQSCTNEMLGYTVRYPPAWYTNAKVEQEFGDPVPACKYFSSQPMDIAPNAGLPPTVAISFERWMEVPPASEGWEVVNREETTVAGLPAVVTEREQTSDAGAPFSAAGDRSYGYEVELPDGTILTAATSTTADGDYSEHKDVLDQMIATLELTGGGAAREPEGPLGP